MRATGSLWFLALLSGCGAASVSDLQAEAVHEVSFGGSERMEDAPLAADHVWVSLHFVWKEDPCTRISGAVKATLNGEPMRFREGQSNDGLFEDSCIRPVFDLRIRREDLPLEPTNAVIELRDGDGRTVIEVQNLLARRGLRPAPEELRELQAGQELTFRWYPPTDAFVSDDFPRNYARGHSFIAVRSPTAEVGNWEAGVGDQEVPGSALVLRIPETAPTGPGVVLWGGQASPPVLRCEGPRKCVSLAAVGGQEPITLQPVP